MTTSNFSAAFCSFIAKICILLFFTVSASKLVQLLITAYDTHTNRIQREFHSNVRIATFGASLASSHPRQNSNFFNRELLSLCFCSLPQCFGEGLGMGVRAETNRIQREFLFNNGILSQNTFPASKHPRKKTNFFKQLAEISRRNKTPSPSGKGLRGQLLLNSAETAEGIGFVITPKPTKKGFSPAGTSKLAEAARTATLPPRPSPVQTTCTDKLLVEPDSSS
jgi:hypothetical protein